ncbi:uncharacterized protein LOC144937101 isoform X2 [Lampetra fluviatilis]
MDLLECGGNSSSESSSSSSRVVSPTSSMIPPPTSLLQGMAGVVGAAQEINQDGRSPALSPCKRKEARGMAYTIRSCGFQVTLDNREVWERFHSWGTEMILTKAGRRMFPYCRYKIRGLDPQSCYLMAIDVVPVDGHRYRWGDGCWMPIERGRPQIPDSVYVHQEGVAPGSFWMYESISFSEVKLTNTALGQDGVISLVPMFKYVTRFHIIRANKVPRHLRLDADNVHTFIFPQTEFFAVTAYQNTAITHLKISHSPLAWSTEPKPDVLNQDEEGGGDGSGLALNSQQGLRERVSLGSSGKRDHACMVGTNDLSYDASRGDGSVGMLEEDVLSDKSTNGDGVIRNKLKRDDNSNGCKDQNTLFDISKVKDEPNDTWQELVENVDPPSSLGGKGESQGVLQNIPLSDCLLPAGNSTCKSNLISKVESARAGAMIVPTSVEQGKDPKCPTSHLLNQNLFPVVRLKQCNISKPTVKLGELPSSVLYSYSIPQISLSRSACGDRPLIVLVSESPPHWSEPTDDVKPSKLCLSEGNGADVSNVEERPGKSPLPVQPLPTIPHLNNEAISGDAMDVIPEDVKPTRSELDMRLLNLTSVPKDDAKETTEHPDAPKGEYVSDNGKGSVLPALKIGHTGFSSWVWTPPKEGNAPAFQLPPPSFSSVSSRSGSLCSRSRTPSPTPGSSQPRGRRAAPRGLAWEAPTQRADAAAATATHHDPRTEPKADRVDVGGVSFFSFSNKEAMLAHRNMEQEKLETLRLSPTLSDNSAEHVSTGRAQERIQRLQDRLQSALSQFQKSKGNDESGADPRFVSRTGKTNDVTKIKGWQHKFGLQTPVSSSGSAGAPDMNTLGKNRSVFLSDKLDEYLQEEEKLLEQRPNMYASKAAGVTFQTPRTGSTYVRTLDSVLRRRAGPARSAGEREAFAQTCTTSPPPPPLPLSGVTQKRGALAGRGKISTAALRATQKSFKRGTRGKRCSRGGKYGSRGGKYGGRAEVVATATPLASPKKVTLPSSPPLTPPLLKPARSCAVSGAALVKNANSRNVNTMLLALEEMALLDGKHRTYITTDRAERSITTLLTPQMTATGMKKLSVRFAAATTSTSHSSSPSSTPAASSRCQKEFCRLGCVCDSLGEGRAEPAHCGKPECMLECSCPPQARHQAGLSMSKQSGITDGTEPEDESFGRHKRRKRLPTRLSGTHVFYDDVASDCYAFWKLTGRKGHKRKLEGLDSEIHKKRIALWSDMDKSSQGNVDSASSNDIPAPEAQSCKTELPPTSNEIKAQMRDELMAWALEDGYTCARVREYGPKERTKANLQCTCGKPHCTEKGPSKSNGKFNKEFKGIIPKEEKLEIQSSSLPKASKKVTTGSSSSGGALCPPVPPIQTGSVGFVQANALSPLTVAWNVVPPITPAITPLKQQMHPSGLPQSKLIEIVSNCNWEAERTRVLSAIAEYSGGQSSGDVTTVQLGDLQLEISHLDNKERFKEKRDPSMTVSYLSGLPSHMCCSRVKIINNPKLSSASSPSKQRAAVASVRSSNSGDSASEEPCQQQNERQPNWSQSKQSSPPLEQQSLQPQQLQKQLLQALNQSEEHVENEIQNSEKELDQQEQTQPQEAKKQQDERLENEEQQPQVVECHSELQQQNEQPEHEPQKRIRSHSLHQQEQRLEDQPKKQQSPPQQNKQQLNQVLLLLPKQQQINDRQQNLVQPQVECKQALDKDVPSQQELKSVEGTRAESSPPAKRSMPSSTAGVERPAAGTSAAAKGGTLNKTLFLTTAAAQAVFNSGAKGVNIIQVNGNFMPQAKLVVGQMGALQAMGPAEKQQSMVPKGNLTLRGHSPFLQVNGNMVTHTKLLVGQMGSLQAIGQSVGPSPFVSTVGNPSPGTNLAFHAATRLVTTPLSPVSITLPDGTMAMPTSGNKPVTHLIMNKVGTLVAGQPFPKSIKLGPSSATSTHVASGAATAAAPGAFGATLAAIVPEATNGPVATAGLVAADGPVSTGGLVTADCPVASGGPVTANRLPTADQPVTDDGPVSAGGLLTACGPASAADAVVACGPVADGEPVGTSGPVAASRSLAAGRLVATGEPEAAVKSAASGETTADDKDSSSTTASLTRAVTTSASAGVPIAVPITSSSPAVAVNLSGGLQLPTGIPIVREVSLADPQRLVLIPMQPPQVRPLANPTANNPIRLPTPAPMLLPGQRMVLQPVKASSGMQLYRHPSGQLVQLVPVRSTRPRHPVSTTADAPKPPSTYTTLRTGLVVHTLNPTGLGLQMRPTGTMLTVARTEVPQVSSTTIASFSAPKGAEVATLEASKSSPVKVSQPPADNVTKSTVTPSSEAVSKQTAEKVLSGGPMTALEMCLVEATKNLEIKREKELWKERLRKLDMEMSKEAKVSPEEICQPIKVEVKLENPVPMSPQAMPGGEQTQAEGDAVNPIVVKAARKEDVNNTDEEDSVSNKSGSGNTAARETAQSMDDESTEMSSDEDSEVDVENLSEGEVSGINYPQQNMDIETVVDTKMKENLSLLRSRVAQKDGMNSQCALHNPEFSNQELSDSDSDDDILKEVRPTRSSLMRSLQLEKLIALKLLSVPMDEFYDPKASLHTVNERRRRSELRDLFKNIKNLLGFPAHTKMSKYALLKQAHSEIQHLQEQGDRMIAEKNNQLRRRDALLRKLVGMTHKKEDVIIRKLEYICAKHRIKEKLKLTSPKDPEEDIKTYILPCNQPLRGRPRKIAPKPSSAGNRQQESSQLDSEEQPLSPQERILPPPPPLQSQPKQQTKPHSQSETESSSQPQAPYESQLRPSLNGRAQTKSEFEQQPDDQLQLQPQSESQPEAQSKSPLHSRSESQQEPELQSQLQPQIHCEPQPQLQPQLVSHLLPLKRQLKACASGNEDTAATTASAPTTIPAAPPLKSSVVSQATKKPSVARSRPLILTRKRPYAVEAHESPTTTTTVTKWTTVSSNAATRRDSPIHVTSDGLLMTSHGQVLTLKGKMLPSHSNASGAQIIMTQGVLQGKPLAPKGHDKVGAGAPGIASVTIRLQCVNVPTSGVSTVTQALEYRNSCCDTTSSTVTSTSSRPVPSLLSGSPVCSQAAVESGASVATVDEAQVSESPEGAPADGSSWAASKEVPDGKSSTDLMETTETAGQDEVEDPDSDLFKIVSVTSLAVEQSNECRTKGDEVPPLKDGIANNASVADNNTPCETVSVDSVGSLASVMSPDADDTHQDNADTSMSDADTESPVAVSPTHSYKGSTVNPSPPSPPVPLEPLTLSTSTRGDNLSKDHPSSCTPASTRTLPTNNSSHALLSHRPTRLPSMFLASGCINAASAMGTIPCSVRLPTLSLSQQTTLALQAAARCLPDPPSKPTATTGPPASLSSLQVKVSSTVPATVTTTTAAVVVADGEESPGPLSPGAQATTHSLGATTGKKPALRPMPQLLQMQQSKVPRVTSRTPRSLPPLSRVAKPPSPLGGDESPGEQSCLD